MDYYNIFLININILCYTLFRFYISFENIDNKSFIDKNINLNNEYFYFLIKTKLKMILADQIVFRLLLVELMHLILYEEYIYPIWCVIFSLYYFYNEFNIYIKIAKFITSFIISYFCLFNAPLFVSIFVHFYSELFTIIFTRFLNNWY